jgi:hypothetical protein
MQYGEGPKKAAACMQVEGAIENDGKNGDMQACGNTEYPGDRDTAPDGTGEKRAAGEAAWFKAHPVMTAEMREKLRSIAEKNRAAILGVGSEKTVPH